MISERDVPVHPPATAGYHVIGYFLNWGFFGALCVQVFLFYWAFPKDRLFLKLVVYGLFALDIIQTALITRDAFFKFGTHFGNVTTFASLENLWLSVFVINAISGTIVQLFFAYRISVLSKSRILGGLVALLAVAGCAAGMASGIRAKISPLTNLGTIAISTKTEFSVWLSISAACDILITTSMVTILSRNRGTGLNPETDHAIKKIIWLTVETGTLTTVVAILTMALTIAFPEKAYCNILMDIIGKIYSNNFLVILNRRIRILDGRSNITQSATQQDSFRFSPPTTKRSGTSETTEVKIERQVWPENNYSREDDM
ncbi:hypothetical protein E1B28_002009 [Marasmius oreades]|uniref:DUF6534 domain-containing protein n=1 Tax=Marasmius oreades TaxID=181124 RepID=A0A9P7V4P4_9AGAR|nr:uncharacterized protein E1B28_002009 [Marasmius oreades]KAG7100235.1 hypothetical protein E1B28_002009 [Marasmius oreades]